MSVSSITILIHERGRVFIPGSFSAAYELLLSVINDSNFILAMNDSNLQSAEMK